MAQIRRDVRLRRRHLVFEWRLRDYFARCTYDQFFEVLFGEFFGFRVFRFSSSLLYSLGPIDRREIFCRLRVAMGRSNCG